jgi:hypothetical protein
VVGMSQLTIWQLVTLTVQFFCCLISQDLISLCRVRHLRCLFTGKHSVSCSGKLPTPLPLLLVQIGLPNHLTDTGANKLRANW